MAHIFADRVRETSATIGTGAYALSGAVTGFQNFDAPMNTADTCFYFASDGNSWEVGLGTFTAPSTLARTTIYASSTGSAINWGSGTIKDVVLGIPARFCDLLNTIEVSLASAASVDIGAAGNSKVEITGTTTITSFGTVAHKVRFVRFSGALTLTHNATSLILPTGANIVTQAGDTAIFASDASGNWRCWSYNSGGTVGGQLKFPATQNASSDPNTLDDYEEGSFTPALNIGGSTTGITYNTQVGDYTKIGNAVRLTFDLILSSKGALTGTVTLTGLPFTAAGATPALAGYINSSNAASNVVPIVSGTTIQPNIFAGGNVGQIDNTALTNTTIFFLAGMYRV
jgi:hypothetical protein